MSTSLLASSGLQSVGIRARPVARKGGPLRVLVCPTAFKESVGAGQVAAAIAEGVGRALPSAIVRCMPVSDGGPGLLDAIRTSGGGEIRVFEVHGPLGHTVEARSLWLSPTEVVIETADACGLHLVAPDLRDPMRADTRGVGELVAACLDQGATRVVAGLGGSATVDGGTGPGVRAPGASAWQREELIRPDLPRASSRAALCFWVC